jgi:hypothetical protein
MFYLNIFFLFTFLYFVLIDNNKVKSELTTTSTAILRPHFELIKRPLNNDHLSTTATINGFLRMIVLHRYDHTFKTVIKRTAIPCHTYNFAKILLILQFFASLYFNVLIRTIQFDNFMSPPYKVLNNIWR